jgi:hypothetical protein
VWCGDGGLYALWEVVRGVQLCEELKGREATSPVVGFQIFWRTSKCPI